MSNCKNCKHKNDRCFCPPNRDCTAYEKEKTKVKHTFEFETSDDWSPSTGLCWTECPFSALIPLGNICDFLIIDGMRCPFMQIK